MSRILYCQRFFSNEQEARQFIKEHGYGALYKNTPRSRSKKAFSIEAAMSGLMSVELQSKNYCVAWNHRLQ